MKRQMIAIRAEFIKNRHAKIKWITFLAFGMVPLFGTIFMVLMKDGGLENLPGAFRTKAELMSFEANWEAFLNLLCQAIGLGGVVIFGFVASWLFGREYADGTAKDLLALPISRIKILNAKFIYYLIWCIALALFVLTAGLLTAALIKLPGWSSEIFIQFLKTFGFTTFLVLLLNTPVAWLALYGKGYLAPLGLVIGLLIFSQMISVLGIGQYFPWAVPALYSGSGGPEMKAALNIYSYLILIIVSIGGYLATILWWKYSDQS